jgi:calcium-dependent protein kinase
LFAQFVTLFVGGFDCRTGQALQTFPQQAFPEPKARTHVLQILRALLHCHERGICHRDIKLQNVLLENHNADAQVKVIDFGNATRFRGQTPLNRVVGTTYTAAPEVFRKNYDERCDVWSLGVVAYIMLSGRRPFERIEIAQNIKSKESSVIASILMGRYHFKHDMWQNVSIQSIDFVKCCLEMDYTRRLHAVELLNHPWFTSGDPSTEVSLQSSAAKSTFAKQTMMNLSSTLVLSRGASRTTLLTNTVTSADPFNAPQELTISETTHDVDISTTGSSFRSTAALSCGKPEGATMRRTSMLAVAFAMPTSRANQIRDLFQEMDHNNNGTIERSEFRIAFQQIYPQLPVGDIDILFDVIDQDDNKSISFLEFIAATIDPREVDVREMNQVCCNSILSSIFDID